MNRSRPQYPGFDAAKLLAALLVMLRHAVQWQFRPGSAEYEIVYCWLSNLAVPVFFAISGFLLFSKAEKPRLLPFRTLAKYVARLFLLYLIWSAVYFPFSWYAYSVNPLQTLPDFLRQYARNFFLTSNVIQLWYLPGLIVACVLVFALVKCYIPSGVVLLASFGVYAFGSWMGYTSMQGSMPGWALDFVDSYFPVFETTRNGFFYGFFFVALGAALSRVKLRALKWPALAGFAASVAGMYFEVKAYGENDMVLCAAPAVACLFLFLRNIEGRPRAVFPEMRALSGWIYFLHAVPLYVFTMLEKEGSLVFIARWPAVWIVLALGLTLSAFFWAVSHAKPLGWLNRLI